MAHLIHLWHERNGWSHRVLPLLSEVLDLGKVHNSQISNLRNGKLSSPGPEVFLALAQVNTILDQGIEKIRDRLEGNYPELWKSLQESALPLKNDSGNPLSAGELFEIFSGLKSLPSSFDWYIEDEEASASGGIDVTISKMKLLVLSAVMTAFGGSMYAQYQLYIAPEVVGGIFISLQIVFAVVAGGVFTMLGPTVGAILTLLLAESLRVIIGTTVVGLDTLIYGILLILFIIYMPKGIVGEIQDRITK